MRDARTLPNARPRRSINCCRRLRQDHPYTFERKAIKEFEENINKRALEDLKRLGLILIKKI